ncbi:hypothetical protein J0H58_36125 [bacterium]|nr:hypothetical protein [bacterium]
MPAARQTLPPPPESRGRSLRLSAPRRLVCDLLHVARTVPTVPVQRVMDVSRVAAARERAGRSVGWCALFVKAFALAARDTPALRRAYLTYPRPRLYEHPFSTASVAVEREFEGEPGVFFAHLPAPDAAPLPALDAALRWHKTAPVREAFGFGLGFARLPRPVRRLAWWYLANVRGNRKAQFLGTFGVSVYSALGAESLHPLSPLTTTLNYGVVGPDGRVPVRLVYDHRVMDGATVARALAAIEEALNTAIAVELADLVPAAGVEPPHLKFLGRSA